MLVTTAADHPRRGAFSPAKVRDPRPGGESAQGADLLDHAAGDLGRARTSSSLSGDLFNLYVALELLTFAAVPLACVDGRAETLAAALRYLLFALFGSIFYLLGAALLYGAFGTLDIALLGERIAAKPLVWTAAAR